VRRFAGFDISVVRRGLSAATRRTISHKIELATAGADRQQPPVESAPRREQQQQQQ